MEEIKYYGSSASYKTNSYIDEYLRLLSLKQQMAEQLVIVPAAYFADKQYIKANQLSISYPVVCWNVSEPKDIKSKLFKNQTAFDSYTSEISESETLMFTKPFYNISGTIVYLHENGYIIQSEGNAYSIAADNSYLFNNLFSKEFVYRLVSQDNRWYVNYFFSAKDNLDILKSKIGPSLTDANAEDFEKFKKGFFSGFNSGKITQINNTLDFTNITLGLNPYTSGIILGLSNVMSFNVEKIKDNFEELLNIDKHKSNVELHNLFIDNEQAYIAKKLQSLPKKKVENLAAFITAFTNTINQIKDVKPYTKPISAISVPDIEVSKNVSFDFCQFRIISNNTLRWQCSNMRYHVQAKINGASQDIFKSKAPGTERDILIGSAKLHPNISYIYPSQANTSAKYARVTKSGDNIVLLDEPEHVVMTIEQFNQEIVKWVFGI